MIPVINDGVDGLLFESENQNDLMNKLDRLMSDDNLRNQLANAGKTRAAIEFTTEEYTRRISDYYMRVLNQ